MGGGAFLIPTANYFLQLVVSFKIHLLSFISGIIWIFFIPFIQNSAALMREAAVPKLFPPSGVMTQFLVVHEIDRID